MPDAKDDDAATTTGGTTEGARRRVKTPAITLTQVRIRLAQLVWLVCVVFALVLAVGALTYALEANPANDLVDFIRSFADKVDLGVFTLENGVKEFVGKDSDTKNALVNWGLGALFWLVIGRVLDRIIRP